MLPGILFNHTRELFYLYLFLNAWVSTSRRSQSLTLPSPLLLASRLMPAAVSSSTRKAITVVALLLPPRSLSLDT